MPSKAARFKQRLPFYFPYLGASVRVTHVAEDFCRIDVEMPPTSFPA